MPRLHEWTANRERGIMTITIDANNIAFLIGAFWALAIGLFWGCGLATWVIIKENSRRNRTATTDDDWNI